MNHSLIARVDTQEKILRNAYARIMPTVPFYTPIIQCNGSLVNSSRYDTKCDVGD